VKRCGALEQRLCEGEEVDEEQKLGVTESGGRKGIGTRMEKTEETDDEDDEGDGEKEWDTKTCVGLSSLLPVMPADNEGRPRIPQSLDINQVSVVTGGSFAGNSDGTPPNIVVRVMICKRCFGGAGSGSADCGS
jgi:hypothetical protein